MLPKYITHLSKDKKFAAVLAKQEPFEVTLREDVWLNLVASIMSQQLSTKVATVIRNRFVDHYKGAPAPALVLETEIAILRSLGLSNAKAQYIHNISHFALGEGMAFEQLQKMTNEEVIAYLTQIKGVGRWTVEMLLMFTLGREDVFAVDDLGIQHAMTAVYRLNAEDKKGMKEKMLKISAKWSPYRTYACIHLWRYMGGPAAGA